MVDALKTEENDEPLKRAPVDLNVFLKKALNYFISTKTRRYFKILDLPEFLIFLNVPSGFLEKDVTEWKEDESYEKSKAIVDSLRKGNNVVERGVVLMELY
ncbi:hypothetical protein AVEN_208297-1 [Araneus ventricosus]|uniref:Uncharacterized protein n=1 Tax=Araneus ventricosus TaxID=182803 RepID=A0A4Y2Q6N4_ARAVE|nr:hypothetical protein AVEN_208297-1 [Araneus ventricosus]